ncbi:hypothetical protein GOP47_0011116 [Adiantum capillus-veneris]|uniref:Uncharacterized protein n=1 Tax=Adiantum capillus-veneris TaxID=13818 RepID=A0A9D4ZF34_ADICA|nr:hypothetical protein GOP47_0011116 [Adiantum capillus-veneris]
MTRAGGQKKAKRVAGSSSQPKSKKATKCSENEPQEVEEVTPMELEGEIQEVEHIVQDADHELQIVDDDLEQEIDERVPAIIDKPLGSDILKALTIHRGKAVPEVPWCRCLINTRVRELRLDLSNLKRAFIHEGYVPIKGLFILSLHLPDGTTKLVDAKIQSTWDKHWVAINEEFEREIVEDPVWSCLFRKMFFVWEGNHRTASWMEAIKEVWSRDKERHVRIRAEFIDPEPKHEVKLLAALQRFKLMNENAIAFTSLRDYLQYTSTLCSCDVDDFMEDFTLVEKMAIERARVKEASGGRKVWYPLTQSLLARMVFSENYKKNMDKDEKKIPSGLPKKEREHKLMLIRKAVTKTFVRKIHRMLCIINPILGKTWFDVLWGLPMFDGSRKITLDKLYQISIAACSHEKKISMLALLGADDNLKSSYGILGGDHEYIRWCAKEVWMEQLLTGASRMLSQVVEKNIGGEQLTLPEHPTLGEYFNDILFRYRDTLFEPLSKEMTVASPAIKQVDLPNAARRVVYRSDSGSIGNMNEDTLRLVQEQQRNILEAEKLQLEKLPAKTGRPKITVADTQGNECVDVDITHVEKRKKSVTNDMIYLPIQSFSRLSHRASKESVAVLESNYIILGKDILAGKFGGEFEKIRSFFLKAGGERRQRHKKTCAWSVDLCVVDLPTGSMVPGYETMPSWNDISDDHVLYSLGIAVAFMDDGGWTLVLCSTSSLPIVERMVSKVRMEVHLRWLAETTEPYAYAGKSDFVVHVSLNKNYIIRGCTPLLHVEEGNAIGKELQQSLDSYILKHFLPSSQRSKQAGNLGSWRGGIEKSLVFMLMFVEFLTASNSTVLELGSGTGPILRACLHTGRCCLGMENDHSIIENHLRPLIASHFVDVGASSSYIPVEDDDIEIFDFQVPTDWSLPCYAADMASFMCQRDDHFDRPLVEKRRTRPIFIDDLALHCDDATSSEDL